MNLRLQIIAILTFSSVLNGCESIGIITGIPTDPAEMHAWYPPTEEELAQRRESQKWLDNLEYEIQQRYLFHGSIQEEEEALLKSLHITEDKIRSLDPPVQKKIEEFKKLLATISILIWKLTLQ